MAVEFLEPPIGWAHPGKYEEILVTVRSETPETTEINISTRILYGDVEVSQSLNHT
ncbi:MAG: hypothetical protein J7M03_00945 [Candidatus Desulfofervidaceae bacterium]|nr:hypothetical protein [Candidatus Desulfofervidaceae bacterium]MDL1971222.1 hypothetical protein [Candidatus Desulfofervidaceae bacterium]